MTRTVWGAEQRGKSRQDDRGSEPQGLPPGRAGLFQAEVKVFTSDYQALTTKILNLVQQAANYKQLRKVREDFI